MKRAFNTEAATHVAAVRAALIEVADAEKAPVMAAYMKDHFAYLGVQAKDRRAAQKPTLIALADADADGLLAFADACWAAPEREVQYVATDILRKYEAKLDAEHLDRVATLITTKSWWDTVDLLAAHTVGPLVARNDELSDVMDTWIDDDNIWLARTAIIHQLSYKERTNSDRLFTYADRRAADTEFFIRKALGWALRQHARTDPEAVRSYVAEREDELSGLTKREAMKHLNRKS